MLENLQQALFLKDTKGRFLYVNDQFCSLIGMKLEDVIGRRDEDLFAPELAAKYRQDDAYVMDKKGSFEVVEENPDPDGQIRYVRVIKKPLVKDGEILGVQGMFWDVTDKFRAEESSRVNEERFRTVARATTDTVWDWDLRTNRVWWSEGVRTVWGYTDKEIGETSDWWISRLHPDDRERVLASVRKILESDEDHWSAEYRCQAADCSYRTILDRGLILRDDAGKAVRMIGSEMDLADRIAAQQALQQSEARFRSFMDNSPAVAWVKDRTYTLRYVNAAYEGMFQVSATELLGKSEREFMPADVADKIQENDRTVMATGRPLQMVEHVPDSSGLMRHWLVSKFPFPGEKDEEWVGGTAFEITDRVKAEGAMWESEERLRLTLEASQDAMWDLVLISTTFGGIRCTKRFWANSRRGRMK